MAFLQLFVVVQLLSRAHLFAAPWTAARQAPLSSTLPEFGQIHVSDSSQWCYLICPLLSLLLLPSILPSIRVFFNELALCIRWPKYWGFSFSISSSNKYSEWIFFSIDWFDLLGVQGTLKKSSPAAQFENINSLALSLPSLVRELDPACYS